MSFAELASYAWSTQANLHGFRALNDWRKTASRPAGERLKNRALHLFIHFPLAPSMPVMSEALLQ